MSNPIESFDGTYIQYDSDGDTCFKTISAGDYLEKMKTNLLDIIEELKSTRSLWKKKLIVEVVYEYDVGNRKVETEIFIHSIKDTKTGTNFSKK